MAHMVRKMAYVGETPWHGLGSQLEAGQPLEVWLKEAGMDYRVCRSRVRYGEGEHARTYDAKHVLFRSDTKEPLGVVSDRYQIVQPAEVLGFFDNLCREHGFQLETAGTLFEGARYWALARTGRSFTLAGNDEVRSYVLLATSADGSLATTGMETSVRVVCHNTLSLAIGHAKSAIRVKHSTTFRASKMQIDMGLVDEHWKAFAEAGKRLAAKRLTRKEAANVLIAALGDPSLKPGDQPRVVAEVFNRYEREATGRELVSADGTAWGLVNAATEHFDYVAGRSPATRLASAWFGPYAAAKERVFETALTAADGAAEMSMADLIASLK